jgi:hypothetical protein
VTRTRLRLFVFGGLAGVLAGFLSLLACGHVSKRVTDEDKQALATFYARYAIVPAGPDNPFEDQIRFIRQLQVAAISMLPQDAGIPNGKPREPADLLKASSGLCFDRSRLIEKALLLQGFRTRHAYLFRGPNGKNVRWRDLFANHVSSHAVCETFTTRGWIVVGTNNGFLSLDENGKVWQLSELAGQVMHSNIRWRLPLVGVPNEFWTLNFKVVYGLYSRHGMFFAPFVPVPDFNLAELLENVRTEK